MSRKTSDFPRHCLLFRKTNSTVPLYANEFVLRKYPFLFQHLPACRQVCRHAERDVCPAYIYDKDSLFPDKEQGDYAGSGMRANRAAEHAEQYRFRIWIFFPYGS